MRAGQSKLSLAREMGITDQTLWRWSKQDAIDRGERPGVPTSEQADLMRAKRRIRELETELAITKRASALFAEGKVRPKGSSR
jgi:transposase-like protein